MHRTSFTRAILFVANVDVNLNVGDFDVALKINAALPSFLPLEFKLKRSRAREPAFSEWTLIG